MPTKRNFYQEIDKAATGIRGFDEITRGGLPRGRTSLVFGGAGCGKTMFAMQFIVNGIREGEPAVFVTFEEDRDKLVRNMRSVGINLEEFERQKKLVIVPVLVEPGELTEVGDFTLDGLFVRLESAIKSVKAKRVALDTMESLFAGFENHKVLRNEFKRLFNWLEARGASSIVTGERGDGMSTRHNLEEYLADCVVFLDHRVKDQISTRRLRVVKYRGTEHATDEFPFLIDRHGFWVMPVTSLDLGHPASNEIVSTGIPDLDRMFAEGGIYRGSSVLVSGTAGTGKTTIAASFVAGACSRGEKALYFAFEESKNQIIRNMQGIGLRLDRCEKKGLLNYVAVRPTVNGLEAHLLKMQRMIEEYEPQVVVVDPMSNFLSVGTTDDVKGMLLRLIDHLKSRQITTLFTSLTEGGAPLEKTDIGVSSLIDTWLLLRDIEFRGERNRGLYVLKSRGTAHSNQIREFVITNRGIALQEVFVGPEGVLIGSARARKIEEERREHSRLPLARRRRERILAQKLKALESQIALLRAGYEVDEERFAEQAAADEGLEVHALDSAELNYRRNFFRVQQNKGANKQFVGPKN